MFLNVLKTVVKLNKKVLKSYFIPTLIAQSSLPPAAGYKTLAAEPTVYLNINQSINLSILKS